MENKPLRRSRTEGREREYRAQRRLGWLFSILVTLVALIALFLVWMRPARVSGDSMSPALREGETVLIDRLAKYWKKPARGDMIAFTTVDGVFIKRIVGLPGETVDIKDGGVFIDSRPLNESAYAENLVGDMEALTVPEGAVFVLGDNRAKIYDSRLAGVGCIPYETLLGVLRVRVSPMERFTIFF